jgi:hypothetical protein
MFKSPCSRHTIPPDGEAARKSGVERGLGRAVPNFPVPLGPARQMTSKCVIFSSREGHLRRPPGAPAGLNARMPQVFKAISRMDQHPARCRVVNSAVYPVDMNRIFRLE